MGNSFLINYFVNNLIQIVKVLLLNSIIIGFIFSVSFFLLNQSLWLSIIFSLGVFASIFILSKQVLDHLAKRKYINDCEQTSFKGVNVNLECQNCREHTPFYYNLNKDEFTCKHCGTKNAIYLNISTAIRNDKDSN